MPAAKRGARRSLGGDHLCVLPPSWWLCSRAFPWALAPALLSGRGSTGGPERLLRREPLDHFVLCAERSAANPLNLDLPLWWGKFSPLGNGRDRYPKPFRDSRPAAEVSDGVVCSHGPDLKPSLFFMQVGPRENLSPLVIKAPYTGLMRKNEPSQFDRERGRYILSLRKALKLSQEALGKMVGVSGAAVHGWERGALPNGENLTALARELSTTPLAILEKGAKGMKKAPPADDLDQLIELYCKLNPRKRALMLQHFRALADIEGDDDPQPVKPATKPHIRK